ncbi:MAG: 1-acyl-sn-glycerol-3-phosphate acyltransferase [Pseudomonadota bacterium]
MPQPPKSVNPYSILVMILGLSYPLIAYCSITHLSVRVASLIIVIILFGSFGLKVLTAGSLRLPLLLQAGAVSLILGAGTMLDDPLYMKLVPVLIAVSTSANFFLSLGKTPIIESFARMKKPQLRPEEVDYARKVTHLWGWTMAVIAVLCLAAALQAGLKLWLILCVPVSYALIGMVFLAEYIFRKFRFRQFDETMAWDRIIKSFVGAGRPRAASSRQGPAGALRASGIYCRSVTGWAIWSLSTGVYMLLVPVLWALLKAGGVAQPRYALQAVNYFFNGWYVRMLPQVFPGLRFTTIGAVAQATIRGPAVVMANHSSIVDLPVCMGLFKQASIVGKRALGRIPVFGLAMAMSGMLFVDRARKFESAQVFAELRERLRLGEILLTFPQGSRRLAWTRRNVKRGLFKLLLEEKVPVLPVAIVGTGLLLKKGQFLVTFDPPLKVMVHVMPPILPEGDPGNINDITAFRDRVFHAINEHLERGQGPGLFPLQD